MVWDSALERAMALNSAPGYLYALAYCLAAGLFVRLNPRRLSGGKLRVVQLAFLVCAVSFSFFTDTQLPVFFLPSLLLVLLLVFLQLWVCCRIPPLNLVYYTLRAFALGELIASTDGYICFYAFPRLPEQYVGGYFLLILLLTCFVLFTVAWLLERRFAERNARLTVSGKMLAQTFLIVLAMYLISNVSNVYQNALFASSVTLDILMIRMLVDLGCALMLYTHHSHFLELDRELENQMLRQLVENQYSNYRMSEQSVALVQQKYHDLKHQIAFLRREWSGAEKLGYLDRLEEEIRSFEASYDTGNRILDTILTGKQLQCQNQDISLQILADGGRLNFLEPSDLVALLGNALDNAVESVLLLPEGEPRLIEVHIGQRKGFETIRIGNGCAETPRFDRGLPLTTRGDSRYHGFGTRSILAIAQKYGGAATFSLEDGWFEVRIVFPVSAEQ